MEAGTSLTTAGSAPVAELVPVPDVVAAEVDVAADELLAAAELVADDEDEDDEELLEPQPTIASAQIAGNPTDSKLLLDFIVLLLVLVITQKASAQDTRNRAAGASAGAPLTKA
ncbi:MAG: hypothetical protein ACYCXW_13620 [Solirubrobacteraceae bacterium]